MFIGPVVNCLLPIDDLKLLLNRQTREVLNFFGIIFAPIIAQIWLYIFTAELSKSTQSSKRKKDLSAYSSLILPTTKSKSGGKSPAQP